jgi:DNA-binding XRE family transcriptional regulator
VRRQVQCEMILIVRGIADDIAVDAVAMEVHQRLGQNIRRLRRARGLAQEKFALQFGIDRTYVSGVERGERNPTVTVVQRFADALGVPIAELFAENE